MITERNKSHSASITDLQNLRQTISTLTNMQNTSNKPGRSGQRKQTVFQKFVNLEENLGEIKDGAFKNQVLSKIQKWGEKRQQMLRD